MVYTPLCYGCNFSFHKSCAISAMSPQCISEYQTFATPSSVLLSRYNEKVRIVPRTMTKRPYTLEKIPKKRIA